MSPTHWVVTGAGGMLARDLLTALADGPGTEVTALTRAELDVTDARAAAEAVRGADVVVNTAAWTDVDGAEPAEEAATRVNGDGAATLAAACAASGARLLHISTDYVFDGTATTPYAEDAPTGPPSAYGRSKLVGEVAVRTVLPDAGYVVRTAWLYGAGGPNFVRTMVRLQGERDTVEVVDDQRGQPTWTVDLAAQLLALGSAAVARRAPAGIYHATNAGETTWFGLTREIFTELGADPERVRPTTTDRFPRPAPRPAYSVLGHDGWARAGIAPMRPWRDALGAAFAAGAFAP